MSRDILLFLEDVQERCRRIVEYTREMTYDDFLNRNVILDAVERNFITIGEAVKNLPMELRQNYSHVNWRKMAGLRDVVVHDYFSLESEILWNIA